MPSHVLALGKSRYAVNMLGDSGGQIDIEELVDELFKLFDQEDSEEGSSPEGSQDGGEAKKEKGDGIITVAEFKTGLNKFNAGLTDEEVAMLLQVRGEGGYRKEGRGTSGIHARTYTHARTHAHTHTTHTRAQSRGRTCALLYGSSSNTAFAVPAMLSVLVWGRRSWTRTAAGRSTRRSSPRCSRSTPRSSRGLQRTPVFRGAFRAPR